MFCEYDPWYLGNLTYPDTYTPDNVFQKIFVRKENVLERKKCTQTRCHLRLKLTRINNFSKNAISLSNERNTVVVVAAAAVYVVFASAVAVVIVVVAVVAAVIDVFAVAAVAIVAGAAHHRKTND